MSIRFNKSEFEKSWQEIQYSLNSQFRSEFGDGTTAHELRMPRNPYDDVVNVESSEIVTLENVQPGTDFAINFRTDVEFLHSLDIHNAHRILNFQSKNYSYRTCSEHHQMYIKQFAKNVIFGSKMLTS